MPAPATANDLLEISFEKAEFAKLQKKLKNLSAKEAKKIMKKATRAGAKVMLPRARSNTPVLSGALRKGVKVKALKRNRVYTGARVTVGEGFNVGRQKLFYGGFVELGYKHSKTGQQIEGKHFLREAFDATYKAALSASVAAAKQGFNETLKRG